MRKSLKGEHDKPFISTAFGEIPSRSPPWPWVTLQELVNQFLESAAEPRTNGRKLITSANASNIKWRTAQGVGHQYLRPDFQADL
jgi:hypothetical protein